MEQLNHLQACHDGVSAGNRRDDGTRNGLRIPPRKAIDAVVLHTEIGGAMDEVHGDGVVLAEDALADETAPVWSIHGRDGGHEALRVRRHRRHPLYIKHGCAACGAAAAALHCFLKDQGSRGWALLRPEVLQGGLLPDVGIEKVCEDRLAYRLAVDDLLGAELAHVSSEVREEVGFVIRAEAKVEEVLGPNQAMHWLLRCRPNRAVGVDLLCRLRLALEALSLAFLDDGDLPKVARAARLEEWPLGGEAEAVHMASSFEVVESVHHDVELRDEFDTVLGLLHVAVMGHNPCARAHLAHCLCCDLGLGPVHVGAAEEELAVQVRDVDGVEVYNLNVPEAGEH
mmetsp:Transcript_125043/g.266884  ORF Transcript_125043/g.266884 Transcript_125043/m.266884 type:complete len:341 (-) Transcript_125043:218-1240(-)